ncbi:MAG: DUF3089 domain-containing protein [Bacteroidales bacterium]|jgi:hypothetical protein
MKKNIFLNSLFIFLILSFSSCLVPRRYFEDDKVTSPPDYSKEKYWAALPTKKDSADAVPHGSGLKDGQANAKADVFFIYPTIYLAGRDWNADINNKRLNRRIDKTTIRLQASVFNGSCKVYAPRYRQAVLASFRNDNENGKKALDFAYQDVKAAFEYYLKYYNNGRPFIIASHSQGTWQATRLLHEYFEKDSVLRKKLIAAYLIGGWIRKNEFKNIPVCDSPTQTDCVICWNSREWGMKTDKYWGSNLECVNPLTWRSDTALAPVTLNLGSVPYGFKRIDMGIADAKISPTGLLWVHKKNTKGYRCIPNYHVLDYNLFWMNIRENVKQRTDAFLKRNK